MGSGLKSLDGQYAHKTTHLHSLLPIMVEFPNANGRLVALKEEIRHFANCRRAAALRLCQTLLRVTAPIHLLTDRQKRAVDRVCPSCRKGILCLLAGIPPNLLPALA